MSTSFKGVVAKLVSYAKILKAGIEKAAEEAPEIAATVAKDAPNVEAVTELVFPGAVAVEELAVESFEALCDAVEAAGPAAAENGLSVSLDKALVGKIQAALPDLKTFAAKL